MKIKSVFLPAVSIAAFALATAPAFAWGDKGHEVVGLIADHYLEKSPALRKKVVDILAAQTDNLMASDTHNPVADNAVWADRYRDSDRNTTKVRYNQTHNWHFIDIEIKDADLDTACNHHPALPAGTPASAGDPKDCVTDKVEQFQAELSSAATPPAERLMALRFLLHFVGDLHQPLHASDDGDEGGNEKRAYSTEAGPSGDKLKSNNLHHHWDTSFVDDLGDSPQEIADDLVAKISNADVTEWSKGTPEEWANDTYEVAKRDAYGKLPQPNARGTYVVNASYISAADSDVAKQLQKAGVRLYVVLKRALGEN